MEGGATQVVLLDQESEFLASDRRTGNEWEVYKENVKPLKRGRNVDMLNKALRCHADNHLRDALLQKRRRLIEAIDDYKGDDPLQPWIECIKWVQESFPSGGEGSGLVLIYEQCVRSFWNSDRYKDDLRYLKVWLEYADNCADAEVVYSFLEANQIGQTHSMYYISYALYLASKNKTKKADEIFNLGISRKAQPIEKLVLSYKSFLLGSNRKRGIAQIDSLDNALPQRTFGTILSSENRVSDNLDPARKKAKLQGKQNNTPLVILDENKPAKERNQTEQVRNDLRPWHNLGTQVERNKENRAATSKWTSVKIPPRAVPRSQMATRCPSIEVFVDDDCSGFPVDQPSTDNSEHSMLQLRSGESKNMKKETELLRENPLRHFPSASLPR